MGPRAGLVDPRAEDREEHLRRSRAYPTHMAPAYAPSSDVLPPIIGGHRASSMPIAGPSSHARGTEPNGSSGSGDEDINAGSKKRKRQPSLSTHTSLPTKAQLLEREAASAAAAAVSPDEGGSDGEGSPTSGDDVGSQHEGSMRLPPIMQVEKQHVTTTATQAASASRRRNDALFKCPVPGCGSTFTRRFNLRGRPFLSTGLEEHLANCMCRSPPLAHGGASLCL